MVDRLGKFYVNMNEVRYNPIEVGNWLSLMNFVPVRVEALYEGMEFEYLGYSPIFRILAAGELAPDYTIEISKTEDGKIVDVKAIEVKK